MKLTKYNTLEDFFNESLKTWDGQARTAFFNGAVACVALINEREDSTEIEKELRQYIDLFHAMAAEIEPFTKTRQ